MTSRSSLADYAGALGKLDPDRGLRLDADRYGWQPKIDGTYVEIHTDADGSIRSAMTRSGRDVVDHLPGFRGMRTGLPSSILQGEADLWTEAAIRSRASRGEAWCHVFDVSRYLGEYVARRPFVARLSLLHAWKAQVLGGAGAKESRDLTGRWHSNRTGDYTRSASIAARRLPLVELVRGSTGAKDLWRAHVEQGFGEGLVAVRLDAPMGVRGAKRKLKATDTLDAVVLDRDKSCARVAWQNTWFIVSCQGKRWLDLAVGDVVEVSHSGWEERELRPRFPRLKSIRRDLTPPVH